MRFFGRNVNNAPMQTEATNNTFMGTRGVGLQVSNEILHTVRSTSQSIEEIFSFTKARYIEGIKDPIFNNVGCWIEGKDCFFTLFGRMGTGKSFFAAKLFEKLGVGGNVIYYSAQKSHSSTTVLRNMLYTVAYKMVALPDAGIRNYLGGHPLPSDIESLTEDIFVKAFEASAPERSVVFILDGLDEYSREDCTEFLNALSARKSRISGKVKIFFTGRPEDYIKSYLPHFSDTDHYDIAEHSESSRIDCVKFIEKRAEEKGVSFSDECRDLLIAKGEYSLNYIDLFLDEHRGWGLISDPEEINSAPKTIYDYYTLQLKKYFTEAGKADFYSRELKGVIAPLTAAKRPLFEEDVCLIAGINRAKLSSLISESAPLIIVKNGIVAFYQDAMKEYFESDACPLQYRIDPTEGDCAIAKAAAALLMRNRFKRSEYFRLHSHEHLVAALDADPFDNEAWDTLFMIFERCITSFSIVDKAARFIISYPGDFLTTFFSELEAASISSVLKERIFTRFLIIAFDNEEYRKRYFKVLFGLSRAPFYKFYERIAASRQKRLIEKNVKEAHSLALEAMKYTSISADEALSLSRKILATDEIIRNSIDLECDWKSIADNFESALKYAKKLEELLFMEGDLTLAVKRDLSVLYDRMGLWLIKCDSSLSAEDRSALIERIGGILNTDTLQDLASLAIEALKRELDLSNECYVSEEFDSGERLADLLPSLKNICRIRTSSAEYRDDAETDLYATRAADTYELIIRLSDSRDGTLGRETCLADAIAFLHKISDNYVALGDGGKAVAYALYAKDFAKRICDSMKNEYYPDHYLAYTLRVVGRTLAAIGGLTDEALGYFGDAISAYSAANLKREDFSEKYASSAALVSAQIADLYTKDDMHKEAIGYRTAAITQLAEVINSHPECSSLALEYEGQLVYLHINKVFASGFDACLESEAYELFAAIERIIGRYGIDKSKSALIENYVSVGYVLACVYAAIFNSEEVYRSLSALRSSVISRGLMAAIGGEFEKAYSAKFVAEVAASRGEDPDNVCELSMKAIECFKEHSSPDSPDDILLAPASCYRKISDAYRAAGDWPMAKKYAASEINEINILTSLPHGERFMINLAECYYRYAMIIECAAAEDDFSTPENDSASDFYLGAVKLASEFESKHPELASDFSKDLKFSCLSELYGIVREDYDAMQELIDNEGDEHEILLFVNEGLRIATEIIDYLSDSSQIDLMDIITAFRDFLNS